MESITLYACRNPETGLYKPTRKGFYIGEPLGNKIKLYKNKKYADLYGLSFSEVVKVKLEVIE